MFSFPRAAVCALAAAAFLVVPAASHAATTTIYKSTYRGYGASAFFSKTLSGCRIKDVHVTTMSPYGVVPIATANAEVLDNGDTYASVDSTVWDGCSGETINQRYGFGKVKFSHKRLSTATVTGSIKLYNISIALPPGPGTLPPPLDPIAAVDADFATIDAVTPPTGGVAPPMPPTTPAETLAIDFRVKALPGIHTHESKDVYRNRAAGYRSISKVQSSDRWGDVYTPSTATTPNFSAWGSVEFHKNSWVDISRYDGGGIAPPVPALAL